MVERADFILELTDEIVGATSRTKRPNQKKPVRQNEPQRAAGIDLRTPMELTAVEWQVTANIILRLRLVKLSLADTQAEACQHCWMRLRAVGAAIHCHEHHSGNIFGDIDRGVAEMMVEKSEI